MASTKVWTYWIIDSVCSADSDVGPTNRKKWVKVKKENPSSSKQFNDRRVNIFRFPDNTPQLSSNKNNFFCNIFFMSSNLYKKIKSKPVIVYARALCHTLWCRECDVDKGNFSNGNCWAFYLFVEEENVLNNAYSMDVFIVVFSWNKNDFIAEYPEHRGWKW